MSIIGAMMTFFILEVICAIVFIQTREDFWKKAMMTFAVVILFLYFVNNI